MNKWNWVMKIEKGIKCKDLELVKRSKYIVMMFVFVVNWGDDVFF